MSVKKKDGRVYGLASLHSSKDVFKVNWKERTSYNLLQDIEFGKWQEVHSLQK